MQRNKQRKRLGCLATFFMRDKMANAILINHQGKDKTENGWQERKNSAFTS
jgi:hypothetical protein